MKRNWRFGCVCLFVFSLAMFTNAHARNRVLWVDSYHQGYAWSDGLEKAITATLSGRDVELKIHRMDTKRNTSVQFKKAAGKRAMELIKSYRPDIVIASDDNASKYLVQPYFKDAALPFVFCGVNHNAKKYDYPYENATGIIELDPIEKLIYSLSYFNRVTKVGYLSGDAATARMNGQLYAKRIRVEMVPRYVKTYGEWRLAFSEMQNQVDILIIGNVSAIKDWNDAAARQYVLDQTKIPTGCVLEFLTPYAFIGYLKLPEEQGRWAARTALKVLSGTKINTIAIGQPVEGHLILNRKVADAAGIKIPKSFLKQADRIID